MKRVEIVVIRFLFKNYILNVLLNKIKYILNGLFMFRFLYRKKFFFLINKYEFNYEIIMEWFFIFYIMFCLLNKKIYVC